MEMPDPTLNQPLVTGEDDTEEMVDEVVDDVQQRLWLRAVSGSVDLLAKMDTTIMDSRIQHAVDMAIISACERISRLCRSDLVDEGAPARDDRRA